MREVKKQKCFGGFVEYWEHDSPATKTPMRFSTYVPSGLIKGGLIWLSGLTCSEENFMAKAGSQKILSDLGLMIICPDTSPRGLQLPGEHDTYDFGSGAGFYVDAQTEGYREHYNMYRYIVDEIYPYINDRFKLQGKVSIFGHSMGGHGALAIGLRKKKKFKSISAFAPIVNPMRCAWGRKALTGYLGEDHDSWRQYDACELVTDGHSHHSAIKIDQGTADEYYSDQLLTENFVEVCRVKQQEIDLNYRDGYDHSYYFISTFLEEHLRFHASQLSSSI